MPPRGGRGQTEEAKKANFDAFVEGEENKCCEAIVKVINTEGTELNKFDRGNDDITDDWQPTLNHLFKLVEVLKVPGRKAKCKCCLFFYLIPTNLKQTITILFVIAYEQAGFRTMVFK